MRQFLLVICMVATALSLFAAVDNASTGVSAFSLVTDNPADREIVFGDAGYSLETVTLDGQTFSSVVAEGGAKISQPGMPDLPAYTTLLAVPSRGAVRLEINGWDETRIPNVIPAPAQEIRLDGSQPEFTLNQDVYTRREAGVYPAVPAFLGDPAIMRDLRLVSVTVQPFAWDASTNELVVRSNISVRVVTDPTQRGVNEITVDRRPSRSFQKLYEGIPGYTRGDGEDDYQQRSILIIHANNTTAANFADDIADWKRCKGFYVQTVSTTTTGTSASSIKSYITGCYNNWADPVEYVIIIGDTSGAMGVATNYESASTYHGETDHLYTTLAGGDVLPEVFIGRISVESASHTTTYWSKIVHYEIQPYMDSTDWYHNTLLISDTGSSGYSTFITNQHARDLIQTYDPAHSFAELTGYAPSPYSIDSEINAGKVVTSYRGIGGLNGWDVSQHINNLTNSFMLSNGVIMTCDTGSFASGTSRSEAWIRAGTPSAPTGGPTCISMATNGTHTPFNNALHGGIFFGLYAQDMPNMGEALMRGKLNMYETYHNFSTNITESFICWCNLMGDPTLDVWKTLPRPLVVTSPTSLEEGVNWIDVTVSTQGQIPLKDAWVTVRQTNTNGVETAFATGYTDAAGFVRLMFNAPQEGELKLVVTKPQYIPHIQDIDIMGGGVAYQALAIGDNGDNDGFADAGETLSLDFTLQNFASSSKSGVSAHLTTDDEFLQITQPDDSFGTIVAGGQSGGSGMTAIVADDCPDGHVISCELEVTSGADSWVSCIEIRVQGFDIDIVGMQIDDSATGNGNGVLDPGETAALQLQIINDGESQLTGIEAVIETASNTVITSDSLGAFGDLNAGASCWNSADRFTITASPVLIPGAMVTLAVHFSTDDGYEEVATFTVNIGTPHVSDPLGPDAGGYYCLDDGDTDYEDYPEYDWIEIDTGLGGPGVNTNLSDYGENGDDVCQVDLPFNFTFYGRVYDQISICSNGWISFLETNQASFRNHQVPGPMGPRAMVAAFWDDLATTNGGQVFTWYDSANHLFVIEWSECRNRYNNSEETFEIILYDPAHYPTPNGNGDIKIQYLEFNNVNQGSTSSYYPEHGLYCTVGLEDHTGLVGLQYTFNNTYPTAAKPIYDHTAILFTSSPESAQSSNLLMTGVQINGETTMSAPFNSDSQMNILLQNIGGQTATNITGELTSNSPYVDITQPDCTWPNLDLLGQQWAQNDFVFHVSSDCPDGSPLDFQLEVTCDQGAWIYPLEIECWAPYVKMTQYAMSDASDDGWLAPGESADLSVWLNNKGHYDASGVEGYITSPHSWVTVTQNTGSLETLAAGSEGTFDTPFTFTVSADAPSPATLWIDLTIVEETGMTVLQQIELNLGFRSDVEHSVDDWSHYVISSYYDEWHRSTVRSVSPSHSWHVGADDGSYHGNQYAALETPEIELAEGSWLSFSHWMRAEDSTSYPGQAYDGAYLEILYGDTWQQITPEGGYPHVSRGSSSPFPIGTHIWSGEFDWTKTWFDLSDYSGTVRFRFVFGSDDGTQYEGWYIDDIMITGAEGMLAAPRELTAQNVGDDVVQLAWQAPVTACQSYNVYRRGSLQAPFTLAANVTSPSYTDDNPFAYVQYYVVTAVYDEGESRYSNYASAETNTSAVEENGVPAVTALDGNYPNPFNPETIIGFSLANPGRVKLAVYNIRGQRVATLVDDSLESGSHEVVWRGRDDNGGDCASGLYLYRLEADGETQTRKMLLLK